jgi:L-lactate dehydrogenase
VLSTGTFLDSLRFRVHLAEHFDVDANQVEAQVIGEHGTSQVFLWSAARIAGVPVGKLVEERGETLDAVRKQVEDDVRYANITIIEGNDASQFGIGIVSARIAEMVLRDERAVVPIGSYHAKFGVTLSLPSIVGRGVVIRSFEPDMSREEAQALMLGAANLRKAEGRTGGRPDRCPSLETDATRTPRRAPVFRRRDFWLPCALSRMHAPRFAARAPATR